MFQLKNLWKGHKPKQEKHLASIVASSNMIAGKNSYLQGQLLVASNSVIDPFFARTVIYVASHDENGAMGLIINREIKDPEASLLVKSMGVQSKDQIKMPVFIGGPVDTGRGFVLHSTDYTGRNTVSLPQDLAITSDRGIIEDYLIGKGPSKLMLVMGYTGWVGGQIEAEIREGSWIVLPSTADFIFNKDSDKKWHNSANIHGIDLFKVSPFVGNA